MYLLYGLDHKRFDCGFDKFFNRNLIFVYMDCKTMDTMWDLPWLLIYLAIGYYWKKYGRAMAALSSPLVKILFQRLLDPQ